MERERFKISIDSGESYATFAVNWLSVTAEMISTLLYNYLLLFLGFRVVFFFYKYYVNRSHSIKKREKKTFYQNVENVVLKLIVCLHCSMNL